jgi:hypothetical protein
VETVADVLLLQGRIYRNGRVDLEPAFHYPNRVSGENGAPSEYLIEFATADGTPILTNRIPVQNTCSQFENLAVFSFSIRVRFPAGAAILRILQGDRELVTRDIASPPKIRRRGDWQWSLEYLLCPP